MTTLVIDRTTPMDTLFSFIGAERVTVSREADRVILTPTKDDAEAEAEAEDEPRYYIDPDNYPDATAFLNAISGFVESIREMEKAPASEWEPVPKEWFNV
jgi:virulence-associated protein VagC